MTYAPENKRNSALILNLYDRVLGMYGHNNDSIDYTRMLLEHYTDQAKVELLFKKGGIYSLRPDITESNRNNDRRYCEFLSEKGNIGYETKTFMKRDDYNLPKFLNDEFMKMRNISRDMLLYMRMNNKWYLYDRSAEFFKELSL